LKDKLLGPISELDKAVADLNSTLLEVDIKPPASFDFQTASIIKEIEANIFECEQELKQREEEREETIRDYDLLMASYIKMPQS
jgi:hypothetical protein